jgi:hypothetical protein
MPRGPKGEKRPADVIGDAVKVMRIATGAGRFSPLGPVVVLRLLAATAPFGSPSLTAFFDQEPHNRKRADAVDPPCAEDPLESEAGHNHE